MTSVITKSALVLAACASLNSFAGPAPAPAKGPIQPVMEESGALFDTLGATLEVGYDSRYYFRGLWFADNTVWAGLSLSIPLTEQLSFGIGTLYTSTAHTDFATVVGGITVSDFDYRELDLSTSFTYDAGFAKFGLVYTHYWFFEGFSGSNFGAPNGAGELNVGSSYEAGLTVAVPLGPVNFYAGYFYDFNIGGSYLEAGVDAPIEITSWLSIVPAIKAGYGFSYFSGRDSVFIAGVATPGAFNAFPDDGFTHLGLSVSTPVKLTRTATLTPYIAYNISGRQRRALNLADNELWGGVKIGVTF